MTLPAKPDARYKLAKLQVLIADRDARSAQLVKRILHAFGIKKIEIVGSGQAALQALRARRFDLLITEWVMEPMGGPELVRSIRASKRDRLMRHDMPILMLTAHSGREHVEAARDVGVTEFVAKPFSARTLSTRLIEIIDRPREFVDAPGFSGPSRRRRCTPPMGVEERRQPREVQLRTGLAAKVSVARADSSLKDMMGGMDASDILTAEVIAEAQLEIMKVEGDFVAWVREDILKLEQAYSRLAAAPHDADARVALLNAAYIIKAQSGVFGYDMGTTVADLLMNFLNEHPSLSENNLIVIRKHIDTMSVIFIQQIKEVESELGQALMESLNKLVVKFT